MKPTQNNRQYREVVSLIKHMERNSSFYALYNSQYSNVEIVFECGDGISFGSVCSIVTIDAYLVAYEA